MKTDVYTFVEDVAKELFGLNRLQAARLATKISEDLLQAWARPRLGSEPITTEELATEFGPLYDYLVEETPQTIAEYATYIDKHNLLDMVLDLRRKHHDAHGFRQAIVDLLESVMGRSIFVKSDISTAGENEDMPYDCSRVTAATVERRAGTTVA